MDIQTSTGTVRATIDREGMICIDGMHDEAEVRAILATLPEFLTRAMAARKNHAIAETLRLRREADAAWYSLVCFGSPSIDGDRVGRGLAERARLCDMADAAMGSGSCSCARVVRSATEEDARDANISTAQNVEYSA